MSSSFGTLEHNRPTSQQSGGMNENGGGNQQNGTDAGADSRPASRRGGFGGGSRPTSALSNGQGGGGDGIAAFGGKNFSTSRGRGRGILLTILACFAYAFDIKKLFH